MSSKYPIIQRNGNMIEVVFADPAKTAKTVRIPMVIDLDWSGKIIGVEIINLALRAGQNCLEEVKRIIPMTGAVVRYGYDEAADSFYLHLEEGLSSTQESVEGVVHVGSGGGIVGLTVGNQ